MFYYYYMRSSFLNSSFWVLLAYRLLMWANESGKGQAQQQRFSVAL